MNNIKICFILLSLSTSVKAINIFRSEQPEDAFLNFTGLATKYGHPVEEHEVITEDGYILTLFRMPGGKKTPVLIIHGTGDHSDSFMIRGNKSLGITLANANYDVWIPNFRGNKYSRKHIKLDPNADPEYWDYGFHERGYYDLAATIDYVLNATGETSLNTIALSQGTSNHFVLLSTRPEYNKKIKLYIALGPVAFLNNIPPSVSLLSAIGPVLSELAQTEGLNHIPFERLQLPKFNKLKCGLESRDLPICILLTAFYLSLFNPKTIEPEFFQVLLGHYPETTTRKNLVHYNQIAISKNFSYYDYGAEENYERYGTILPPEYDLRKVTVNTALLVGRQDILATVKDSVLIRSLLPNVILYHIMKPKTWSHIDFNWRNDMDVHLFPIILELLEKHK